MLLFIFGNFLNLILRESTLLYHTAESTFSVLIREEDFNFSKWLIIIYIKNITIFFFFM
jgi:hypothetical protein